VDRLGTCLFTATFASFDASPRQDTWHHHGDPRRHRVSGGRLRCRNRSRTDRSGV